MNLQKILARIEERIEELGTNASAVSKAAGKPDAINNIKRAVKRGGKGSVTIDTLRALAPVLQVSVNWLIGDESGDDLDDITNLSPGPDRYVDANGEPVHIPDSGIREVDVRAGLGGGGVVPQFYSNDGRRDVIDAFKPEPWLLPSRFIRSGFHVPPKYVIAIETKGESMAPTINHGDIVFIDTTHMRISPPGLYALRDAYGEIIVKRLDVFRSGDEYRVSIVSDNPHERPKDEPISEVSIVGRVCGMFKLM